MGPSAATDRTQEELCRGCPPIPSMPGLNRREVVSHARRRKCGHGTPEMRTRDTGNVETGHRKCGHGTPETGTRARRWVFRGCRERLSCRNTVGITRINWAMDDVRHRCSRSWGTKHSFVPCEDRAQRAALEVTLHHVSLTGPGKSSHQRQTGMEGNPDPEHPTPSTLTSRHSQAL